MSSGAFRGGNRVARAPWEPARQDRSNVTGRFRRSPAAPRFRPSGGWGTRGAVGYGALALIAGRAPVAQRIEHLTTDQKVGVSNTSGRATSGLAPATVG